MNKQHWVSKQDVHHADCIELMCELLPYFWTETLLLACLSKLVSQVVKEVIQFLLLVKVSLFVFCEKLEEGKLCA